jgi:hypothetical protein
MDASKSQIPINTRTVGNPELNPVGNNTYTLYIEDYVHTFMQKNLVDSKYAIKIALFGKRFDEKLIISGAALSSGNVSKDKDTCAVYFPNCQYFGTAAIIKNDKNNIRFEIATGGIIILIEDYYIYYDQNEEMQNYLISWNESLQRTNQRQPRNTDAAHYGKILQAYNKEEAKVSFMWNVLTLLCLGFMISFMAYGIITINSYSKMQSIQSGIDYCVKMLDMQLVNVGSDDIQKDGADDEVVAAVNTDISNTDVIEISKFEESESENETYESESIETINNDIPQYYIVQKGDTLRSICYEIYGDYEYVEKVCLWNDIKDPNNILCGQKLLLK